MSEKAQNCKPWVELFKLLAGHKVKMLLVSLGFVLESILAGKVGYQVIQDMQMRITRHAIDQDADFHSKHKPGELQSRILGDTKDFYTFFTGFYPAIIFSLTTLVGSTVVLLTKEPSLAIAYLVLISFTFAVIAYLRNLAVDANEKMQEAGGALSGELEELIDGAQEIVANDGVTWALKKHYRSSRRFYWRHRNTLKTERLMIVAGLLLTGMVGMAAASVGGHLSTRML